MNTKIVFSIASLIMLSACAVSPHHKGHKVKMSVPVKTVFVLEQEHEGRNVLVVQSKRNNNCWMYKKHWRCNHR
jgi:hypothetical protein